MYIIGLTGGIATGKSTICHMLAKHFPVIDGDAVTADEYVHNPMLIHEIAATFPEAVIDEKVSKIKLIDAILTNPENLDTLEQIVHPHIIEALVHRAQEKLDEKHPIVIVCAPLLFETQLAAACHAIICLDAKPETQKARAMQRPYMTEKQFDLIYNHQWPTEKKKKRATITVSTEQPVAETEAEILTFLHRFLKHGKEKIPLISCKY